MHQNIFEVPKTAHSVENTANTHANTRTQIPLQVQQEVEPGKEDGHGARLPLQVQEVAEERRRYEQRRRHVQRPLHQVREVEEVTPPLQRRNKP